MAELFHFPDKGARSWRDVEAVLRATYGDTPFDGPVLDSVIVKMRGHFDMIFKPIEFPLSVVLPGASTGDDEQKARDIINAVADQVHSVVMRERHAVFALLASAELQLAYWLHHGKEA